MSAVLAPEARASAPARPPRAPRLRVGRLWVDALTRGGALDAIEALVAGGRGGAVFTPNVDHVVTAERDDAFVAAYEGASVSLADGVPVVLASRLLGVPVPEKLSGSDMLLPIAERAAARGWRVYLLGGGPGAADAAARRLRDEYGVHVVGADGAFVSRGPDPEADAPVLDRIRAARPDVVFVALGAPKQEMFVTRARPQLDPAVWVCVGASLDFLAGTLRRSPAWMSRFGLEWLYRLAQEPLRLAPRYLVRDPAFLLILWRTLRTPRAERVRGAA